MHIHKLSGMSYVYSLVAMTRIRYLSVVRYERRWHSPTLATFWNNRYLQVIWFCSFLMAAPLLVDIETFTKDVTMKR